MWLPQGILLYLYGYGCYVRFPRFFWHSGEIRGRPPLDFGIFDFPLQNLLLVKIRGEAFSDITPRSEPSRIFFVLKATKNFFQFFFLENFLPRSNFL